MPALFLPLTPIYFTDLYLVVGRINLGVILLVNGIIIIGCFYGKLARERI